MERLSYLHKSFDVTDIAPLLRIVPINVILLMEEK